jgi:hypothetical protein
MIINTMKKAKAKLDKMKKDENEEMLNKKRGITKGAMKVEKLEIEVVNE